MACDWLTGSLTVECMFVVPCQVTRHLKNSSICYNIWNLSVSTQYFFSKWLSLRTSGEYLKSLIVWSFNEDRVCCLWSWNTFLIRLNHFKFPPKHASHSVTKISFLGNPACTEFKIQPKCRIAFLCCIFQQSAIHHPKLYLAASLRFLEERVSTTCELIEQKILFPPRNKFITPH